MSLDLKWYDSVWLNAYMSALEIIEKVAPQRFDDFTAAFDCLRTDPSFSVKKMEGFINPADLSDLKQTLKAIPREKLELHELQRFGRFVVHDNPAVTKLQNSLVGTVSDWAGEAVEPSYNFLSFYTHKGVCEPHLDSPSAKWTLDICLDQNEPWPIQFSQILSWPEKPTHFSEGWREEIKADEELHFESAIMDPGDALFFSGSSQWHYRDPMNAKNGRAFCDLLFLHFMPEGTSELVQAKNWPRIFDIPELAQISGIEKAR